MFSWLLKLRQKKIGGPVVKKGTTIEIGGEWFYLEGARSLSSSEAFKGLDTRFTELKSLLARHEATIAKQQATIASLNERIGTLSHQVDAQTNLSEQYGRLFESIPGLVAGFITSQAKEISQGKSARKDLTVPERTGLS